MKIVVIGGTGLIGAKLVGILRGKGHDVMAASPNSGVNTITGEGLAEALKGARVVVDVANSPTSKIARRWISSRPPGAICSPPTRPRASRTTSRCRLSAPTACRRAAISAPSWCRRI